MRNRRRFALWVGFFVVCVATIIIVRSVQRHRELTETLLWIDQTYNPHDGGHNSGHGSVVHSIGGEEVTDKTSFVRLSGCKIAIKEFWNENPIATYTFSLCDIDPVSIKMTTLDRGISPGTSCPDDAELLLRFGHRNRRSGQRGVGHQPGQRALGMERPATAGKLATSYDLNCESAATVEFLMTDGAHVINAHDINEAAMMVINPWELDLGRPPLEMRDEKRTSTTYMGELVVDDVAYAQRLANGLKRAVELCGGKPSQFWPPHWKSKIFEEEGTTTINLSAVTNSSRTEVFHEVRHACRLPRAVLDKVGGIAGPGQPFNIGDAVDCRLPMRKLIVAAVSEKYCIVSVVRGGYTSSLETMIFELSEGTVRRMWVATGGGFNFQDLKNTIEAEDLLHFAQVRW